MSLETSFNLVQFKQSVAQLVDRLLSNLALVVKFISKSTGLEAREDVHALNDHVVVETLFLAYFVEVKVGYLPDTHVI